MLEGIASFLTALRQSSPVVLLGISIACGAILFIPNDVASTIGLNEFRQQYRGYIGGLFIIASSMFVAQCCWWLSQGIKSGFDRRRVLKNRRNYLHELTPDEKAYLIPFVLKDKNTQYFSIEDGIVGGLVAKKIIYQASSVGDMLDGFAYNIQPWAKQYLKKNSHLLKGANPNPKDPRDKYRW